jgi:hypothetical protein
VTERGRTVQNILLRRKYHPTAIGNREVKVEGNVVDLSLLGVEESAQRVCKYFSALDDTGEWLSEIVLCGLLTQAQRYAANGWVPHPPLVSSIIELVAYQWYFDRKGIAGFRDKYNETWGQLNGKAESAMSGGSIAELLNAVTDFTNEWEFMYRLEQIGYEVGEMHTTGGVEFVLESGHAVEMFRKRSDPSFPVTFTDDGPRFTAGRQVTNLPSALQSAWDLAQHRIKKKVERASKPLDIIAVDITSRMAGMKLMGIAGLSNTGHFSLHNQMGQAVRIAERGGPAILFYTRPRSCGRAAAVAIPLDPEFPWYGALGAPSVRVRPLRPSDLNTFRN